MFQLQHVLSLKTVLHLFMVTTTKVELHDDKELVSPQIEKNFLSE